MKNPAYWRGFGSGIVLAAAISGAVIFPARTLNRTRNQQKATAALIPVLTPPIQRPRSDTCPADLAESRTEAEDYRTKYQSLLAEETAEKGHLATCNTSLKGAWSLIYQQNRATMNSIDTDRAAREQAQDAQASLDVCQQGMRQIRDRVQAGQQLTPDQQAFVQMARIVLAVVRR